MYDIVSRLAEKANLIKMYIEDLSEAEYEDLNFVSDFFTQHEMNAMLLGGDRTPERIKFLKAAEFIKTIKQIKKDLE
jgi:hypothetical protein